MSRIAAATAAGLVVGLVMVPGTAQAAPSVATTADRAPRISTTHPDRPITQLIVKTTGGGATTTTIRAAAASLSGVDAASRLRRTATGADVIALSAPVSLADAYAAAKALTARADVVYAEPDRWVYPTDASPVFPNDPDFVDQWDLWTDSLFSVPVVPAGGGYSSTAPAAWVAGGTGSAGVVVSVIDTGITTHPDLVGQTVPGYDFVSQDVTTFDYPVPGTYSYTANDGDGRDTDPSDPGDWISTEESLGTDVTQGWFDAAFCGPQADSRGHGTHVAGTIAALQGNTLGISGVAPGVKVQPVRALGKCGGYMSDVNDAIVWAAGGSVPTSALNPVAPPVNSTPATVINLSLGNTGACLTSTQESINSARANGATVVVAAGNSSQSITSTSDLNGSAPANCSGVIAVTATGLDGHVAAYSNVGDATHPATIAGQGGDGISGGDNILSTVNQGLEGPIGPADPGYIVGADFGLKAGTSMATPHVAAGVALMQSQLTTPLTPDQVKARLQATATPFPALAHSGAACTSSVCGAGILDIAAALATAPAAPATVTGTPADLGVDLSWTAAVDNGAPITGYHVQVATDPPFTTWTDVAANTGTAATTLHVGSLANGTEYKFRVSAFNELGEGPATDSNQVIPSALTPPTAVAVTGGVERLHVSWGVPESTGGDAIQEYGVRYRRVGATDWLCPPDTDALPTCFTGSTALSWDITTWPAAMAPGQYEVQVSANTTVATSAWSTSATATVTALSQTSAVSATSFRPFADGYQDTVRITATSNVPTTGNVQILNAAGSRVATLPLSSPSAMSVLWNGRINGLATGARVPFGTYRVQTFLVGRSPGVTRVLPDKFVTVASSQVGLPAIAPLFTTVYPYVDAYRDTVPITVKTTVPATQIWKFTNRTGSVVYRTLSLSRRTSATVAWNGKDSRNRTLPNGTYYLRVYVKGGEGTQLSAYKTIAVSSKRVIPIAYSAEYRASSVIRARSTTGVLAGARTGGIKFGSQGIATFSVSLPSSVRPMTGLRVATCTQVTATATSSGREGFYSGASNNPTYIGTEYVMGRALGCYETGTAPSASMFSNGMHWYVMNRGPAGSYWEADTFLISGTRYVLG